MEGVIACSWIELKEKYNGFLVDDNSLPRSAIAFGLMYTSQIGHCLWTGVAAKITGKINNKRAVKL
jgi:hypothetical protein